MNPALQQANKWRSNYNPLRALTIQRAVSLLEAGERGDFADLQWTFRCIEKRDATLRALKRLRLSAIGKLDWSIKIVDQENIDKSLAKQQKAELRAAYDRIGNLREAITFLALAEFRGYSHLEKVFDGTAITCLQPVPQWHWCRDGIYGAWKFNPKSLSSTKGEDVDLGRFVVREVEDPIGEISLICFIRKNLSQKDWDAFVETYGIPPLFVEMPQNVPAEKEDEYQETAEAVVGDLRGALPNGAKIQTVDAGARGTNPFKAHLDYQREEVVLAGTSGKLTMLNGPTGMGSGQSDLHQSVFDDLAIAEAGVISEIFQRQFDREILSAKFPDAPVLAYFEIAAEDREDVDSLVDRASKLYQAGMQVDVEEMSEKLGLKLTRSVSAPAPGAIHNRRKEDPRTGKFMAKARLELGEAAAQDIAPLRELISRVIDDPSAAASLKNELPKIARRLLKNPLLADRLEGLLGAAMVSGLTEKPEEAKK